MQTEHAAENDFQMEAHIDVLTKGMTLGEQVSLLAGADFWTTVPIERLGIPAIKVSDGPNGARGGGSLVGGVTAAAFPVGISLASTWNTTLVEEVGQALAEEAQSKGARVLLAPTVNIHRSPLNGRNFECYSEDPFLAAQMAVAYISGVQSRGVAATVKHFAGNESEFERMTISSEIDERALREIYLPPFEAAVKQARVWALMSAYNKINGVYASEHGRMLNELLKKEWAFDGVVMSDWYATHSTAEAAANGLDLEMPGPARHRGQKLLQAVETGLVSVSAIKESVRRLLRLFARVGAFQNPTTADEQASDQPEHRALIRRAGAEGIVLLKNNGILPLEANTLRSIAVIGPNASTAQIMGGGSAQVNARYRVSPLEGIRAQAGPGVEIRHEIGCSNYRLLPLVKERFTVEYCRTFDLLGEVAAQGQIAGGEVMWLERVAPGVSMECFSARLSTRFIPDSDGEYHFGLTSAGLSRLLLNGALLVDNWNGWQAGDTYFGDGSKEAIGKAVLQAGESYDLVIEYSGQAQGALGLRAVRVGAAQPLGDAAIEAAVQAAAASDVALLFLGLNGEWDTEGQDRPDMELVGRQNDLVERVTAANPNTVVVLQTGGPVAMPWLDRVAGVLQAWYPGQECGNAIADVLFGAACPGGRLPQTFPVRLEDNPAFVNYPGENGRVRYGEGIFVGYRYYDKKRVEPLFPFGYGLSYTTFSHENLRLSAETIAPDGEITLTVDVSNTGTRPGQEVVQLYVRDEEAHLVRPLQELKGFAKISLKPGQSQSVTFILGMRDLAYFDDAKAAWVAEAGKFEALVGSSSRDIRAQASFSLSADWVQPVPVEVNPLVDV